METDSIAQPAVIRPAATARKLGVSLSTIRNYVGSGVLPKPISLGGRAVGFLASEIDAYLAARIAARNVPAKSASIGGAA